jgi:hypothetical protein
VNTAAPDGAADPQASATKGSLYIRPGTTDDYSQLYMKVADNDADADWQKVLVNNNEEPVSIEANWTWDAANRIQVRDSTLYIYSPSASTGFIALAASGDVWRIGDPSGNNYIQVNFRGEATMVGTARVEPMGAFIFFDDFTNYQTWVEAETPFVFNSGTDDLAVDPAIVSEEYGVATLVTGDDDGTTAVDGSQMVFHVPVQADSGGLVFETRLHIDTAITNISVFCGLTDTTALEEPFTNAADVITSNADDACGFLYDTDATTDEWWMLSVDSTADDSGNATTGTAPVADIYQIFRIEVASDGDSIEFFIDGTSEGTLSNTGVSPDVNLYATVIACGDSTASKSVDVDYVYVAHNR